MPDVTKMPGGCNMDTELSAQCALSTTNYSIVFVHYMFYSFSEVCFAHSCIFLRQLTCAKYKFNAPDVTKTPSGCNMDTELSGGFFSTRQTTLGCKKYEPYFSVNLLPDAIKHDKLSAECVPFNCLSMDLILWHFYHHLPT